MQKLWSFTAVDAGEKKSLAADAGISEVVAGILLHRGITDKDKAEQFLDTEKQPFHDAFLMKDMDKAVARIEAAIEKQENITVYGDYDVDGITATVVLVRTLQALGAKADFYIPDRQAEGYGFNVAALEKIGQTTDLLISVDCGISAVDEVGRAQTAMDIIITDHHLPGPVLPPVVAVVDPHRPDCIYPDKNLAGVGVAFKLCQALWSSCKAVPFAGDLDIVALGTVADIVPLLGENRRMVKCGLQKMQKTDNIGLSQLMAVCDLTDKKIDAGHIGFVLAPRLNAAGRLASASLGVELLLTEDRQRAYDLAKLLNDDNIERQLLEKEILAKAEETLAALDVEQEKVLVLAGEGWHTGVIGIVASRIVEKYYKPVIIIGIKDGVGKGSCRSIRGFHMHEALTECRDSLLGFGGHAQAAGLSILPENIPLLRQQMTGVAERVLTEKDYIPVLAVESTLAVDRVDEKLMDELVQLEPYGMGNPRPVFVCQDVAVRTPRKIGREGAHLRFTLEQGGSRKNAVAWNKGELAREIDQARLDLAFQPEINIWQGNTSIQFKVQDLRLAAQPGEAEEFPQRETIGKIYLLLKRHRKPDGTVSLQAREIAAEYKKIYRSEIAVFSVEVSIKILTELQLLAAGTQIRFEPDPKQKLNLMQSPTFAAGAKQQKN